MISFISSPTGPTARSPARLFAMPVTSRRPRFHASYRLNPSRRSLTATKAQPEAPFQSESDDPTAPSPSSVTPTPSPTLQNSTQSHQSSESPPAPIADVHTELPSDNHSSAQNGVVKDKPKKKQSSTKIPISIGPLNFSIPARSLLYTVPFLWGSFAPAVRYLFAQNPHQDPSVFNSERLLLSTLVYAPILLPEIQAFLQSRSNTSTDNKQPSNEDRFSFFPAGLELGVYVFLANIAQVVGLEQTSASRAAFLVQLQTVFVPILGTVLGLDNISFTNGLSSFVAVAGVFLLSADKPRGAVSSITGDALEVLSAIFFSAYIVRLGAFCNKVSPNQLVATKIATQAVLSIGWAIFAESSVAIRHAPHTIISDGTTVTAAPWTLPAIAVGAAVVLWTGIFPSAISGWAQTKGQQGVKPSDAVLIYATQPLWSAGLAALLLGETFGVKGLFGGGLIVLSSLLPSLTSSIPFFQRLDDKQSSKDDDNQR